MPGWVDDFLTNPTFNIVVGALIASVIGVATELWREDRLDKRTGRREHEARQRTYAEKLQEALLDLRQRFLIVLDPDYDISDKTDQLIHDLLRDIKWMRSLGKRLTPGPVQKALADLPDRFIETAEVLGTDKEAEANQRFNVAADALDDELGKLMR